MSINCYQCSKRVLPYREDVYLVSAIVFDKENNELAISSLKSFLDDPNNLLKNHI